MVLRREPDSGIAADGVAIAVVAPGVLIEYVNEVAAPEILQKALRISPATRNVALSMGKHVNRVGLGLLDDCSALISDVRGITGCGRSRTACFRCGGEPRSGVVSHGKHRPRSGGAFREIA